MRLCEAPHFNEDGPRRIPALAAASETPVLPQPLPPSPAPPPPRSPGRAQPGEDSSVREAAPSVATKTPGGDSPGTVRG